MAEMQEKGLIKRVNSRKNGKWIVKLYNKQDCGVYSYKKQAGLIIQSRLF